MTCPALNRLCLLLALAFSQAGWAAGLDLTAAEQQWLKAHPVIRIAPDPDYRPFEWFSNEGVYEGIVAEYMQLIGNKLGIRFDLIKADRWSEVIAMAKKREVDVLPAIVHSEQREEFLLFTSNYISVPGVLVSSLNHMGIDQLDGHQVAVVRDYIWDERLSAANTGILIKRVDDLEFGLELASLGAVEAMITDIASATSMIERKSINNLHIMSDASRKLGQLEMAIGVRTDWPELRSILDKALASISTSEKRIIRAKWISFKQPAFWRDRDFWHYTLIVFIVLAALFSGFFFWNRTLKKQVELQSHELHAAQLHLMHAEKMESVGRLAAGVAHEVKNPLAIIQMGADYLSEEMPENENITAVIEDINDAVRRANAVILGLLDFSRHKHLELKADSINQVILSSLRLVEHELRQRSITARTELADNLPLIALDANKLQQVFINLFINAAHAMDQKGELMVSSHLELLENIAEVELRRKDIFQPGDKIIRVEVTDTGPGINEQDETKIFDLFYTTKNVGEGTGLGLSVSRNIVNLHNGCIDIANRPQGGAKVVLLFKLE